jgi:hypothetical protein
VRESDVAAAAEARGRAHKAATKCERQDAIPQRSAALSKHCDESARAPLCNTLLSLTFLSAFQLTALR